MTYKGVISPETLPPTARAAHFHGLRVHHQVLDWSFSEEDYKPTEWGWTVENNSFVPIMTDYDVAPSEVKTIIRCHCKVKRKNVCDSCSCRKYGLKCTSLCLGCRGEKCSNTEVNILSFQFFKLYLTNSDLFLFRLLTLS